MNQIRVVLIEPNNLTRTRLRLGLQHTKGIQVVGEAADGKSGLKLLEATQPDLAIVEICLSELNGIELIRRVKAVQTASELSPPTKVLIFTLQQHQEQVVTAFAAGADSYCLKHVSFKQLLRVLRVTHQGQAWLDPVIAPIVLQQSLRAYHLANATIKPPAAQLKAVNSDQHQLRETEPLTPRELEILQLIAQGYSNAAIAQQLYLTVGTVKTYVRNILTKFCIEDRTQAAVLALRSGLVS